MSDIHIASDLNANARHEDPAVDAHAEGELSGAQNEGAFGLSGVADGGASYAGEHGSAALDLDVGLDGATDDGDADLGGALEGGYAFDSERASGSLDVGGMLNGSAGEGRADVSGALEGAGSLATDDLGTGAEGAFDGVAGGADGNVDASVEGAFDAWLAAMEDLFANVSASIGAALGL